MTATLQQIESSSRLLGDEVEAWLKQITPISSPANPLSASPVSAPAAEHGFDIKALVAAGVAEVERSQKATATAQQLARPGLLARITRRHLRPADRASVHIRRAAAELATGGWCRGVLRDTRPPAPPIYARSSRRAQETTKTSAQAIATTAGS
ncbi:hypothetical protein BGM19_36965 [Streptomyces agglomeratus]|uniref:Uncharacterized protein n=1 Tax=Streptomyces agglomeratus TaxID=285458 RepID=A0A1E5NY35_9ACTN|nr:hypothetical protein [Streptomyces agglomeratus]OEJ21218.1 hypothetical protein AS594_36900 [Streptomyces agglomeratus]OEJ36606.1 hypothetical protein BGK72_36090 [Streptomyces agglomeratus]OEJ56324.1 hypothetical protein BGM19_36965 [Streptomyces agglomeratus]